MSLSVFIYCERVRRCGHAHRAPHLIVTKSLTTPWQPQWNKPRKGDPNGKGMVRNNTGGKGKTTKEKSKAAGKPDWPSHWAFKDPKNVAYCRGFLLYKTCTGQWGRSHNCPVRVDGWICDATPGTHPPEANDRRPTQVPQALSKPPQYKGLHQDSLPRGRTSTVHTTTNVMAPRTLGYTLR